MYPLLVALMSSSMSSCGLSGSFFLIVSLISASMSLTRSWTAQVLFRPSLPPSIPRQQSHAKSNPPRWPAARRIVSFNLTHAWLFTSNTSWTGKFFSIEWFPSVKKWQASLPVLGNFVFVLQDVWPVLTMSCILLWNCRNTSFRSPWPKPKK